MLTILIITGKKSLGASVQMGMVSLLRRYRGTWTSLLLLPVLLVACGFPPDSAKDVPTSVPQAVSTFTPPAESAANPTPGAPPATRTPITAAEATSRGPELEASDPETVALASGKLQLVEFFRFT
jgi:hypothetical protein